MAKLTDRTALGAAPATNDLLFVTDVSDTTDAATGTDKKMTVADIFTSPSFTTPSLGVATATSINGATITSGTLNGSVTGSNTGDQTSIVGITGTVAQFNTAITDGDLATGGGTATGTNTGDQTTIVGITGTKAQFDTAVSDGNIMFDGDSITNATANTHKVFYSDGSGVITELALGADGTFLKSNGAAVAPSFATPAGSGDVSKVGTPVDNQVGVWTGDGTIEGDASLTFDTATDVLGTAKAVVSPDTAAQITTLMIGAGTVFTPNFQVLGATNSASIGFARFNSGATIAPRFALGKSRGTTIGDYTITQSGDALGEFAWNGSDGTDFAPAAAIGAFVDGTPGSNDMPGRIVFSTTADGAAAVTDRIIIDSAGAMKPATNDGSALGNTTNQFSDLFLAEGGVINWDNGDATITQTANDITVAGITTFGVGTSTALTTGTIELGAASDTTLSRSAAGVLAVEGVVVPSISSTNTLTNKRVTKRVTTTNAPGATPTTNTDNVDVMNFTGLNAAITSMTTNLSGTPVDGDLIMFRFTDDGTARAITWGASFAATTVALPTTTVISTMLRVGFQYSGSTWKCIATA